MKRQGKDFDAGQDPYSQSLKDKPRYEMNCDGELEDCEDQANVLNGKRYEDIRDCARKKFKGLPVSYEEWEPYSAVLRTLAQDSGFNGDPQDVVEQKELALKMATPEGLQEIIGELEAKLARFEDVPVDPDFEKMSISDKIDALLKGTLNS